MPNHRSFHHRLALSLTLPLMIFAILVLMRAEGSVIRCVGPDGRVSYQDKSCDSGAPGVPVDATPNRGFQFATKQQIEKASRPPPDEARMPEPQTAGKTKVKVRKVLNAGDRRFIRTGMHAAEVRRKFGPPDQIDYPVSASGKPDRTGSRQWIYLPADDDPQTTTVVTVRSGMVLHVDRKVTR